MSDDQTIYLGNVIRELDSGNKISAIKEVGGLGCRSAVTSTWSDMQQIVNSLNQIVTTVSNDYLELRRDFNKLSMAVNEQGQLLKDIIDMLEGD